MRYIGNETAVWETTTLPRATEAPAVRVDRDEPNDCWYIMIVYKAEDGQQRMYQIRVLGPAATPAQATCGPLALVGG